MKICVLGLWHLGAVTAAGLAALGHEVIGLDLDESAAAPLRAGRAPVLEPGLDQLLGRGLDCGRLRFSSSIAEATAGIELLWVACDTPLDDADAADSHGVLGQIEQVMLALESDVLVLLSSQLPVGSARWLERSAAARAAGGQLELACCPENLRLGSAVHDFLHPSRIIAGVRTGRARALLEPLLSSLSDRIEWMSVESAEMTKHAINAYFATSIAFANELASICEFVGADAKQVERGLKSEARIGPHAYLAPGAAFAGGTLARDVAYLNRAACEHGVQAPLLAAVLPSNEVHKHWAQARLRALLHDLSRSSIAVWGLTYKAGTDTLRRSLAVELCDWMIAQGAHVHVHDPAARQLPAHWPAQSVQRHAEPLAAVRDAQVLIVATEWPLYRAISLEQLLAGRGAAALAVLDANRFLPQFAAAHARLRYFAVGLPREAA